MTSPYLRAAAKLPKVKLQAKERRDKRQGNGMGPGKPDKPLKPPKSK
jgi:hypothetical protein